MKRPVSACVIARDDERTLRRCLASLAWVDDCVLVVDERSADASEAVARSLGARVFRRPFSGQADQKNFALSQAKGDWVVCLDADEALSDTLLGSVRRFLDGDGGGADGAFANRLTHHLGRALRHGDFHPDWQLRVFRRERGRWCGREPHPSVVLDGRAGRLEGFLLHWSYADLADQVARIQAFSAIEARGLLEEGRRARTADLTLRPAARFLRAYLWKRGFLDGTPGLVVAAATAFHVFLKYAKLWELERRA